MRRLISQNSPFEKSIGFSRAVVDGDWVFLAGTTGFDYASMTISDDVAEQCAQALKNIESALQEAGSGFSDVVRVRYYLPDLDDFPSCWPKLKATFGAAPPAGTAVEAGLVDPRMKIEIEVTAKKRG